MNAPHPKPSEVRHPIASRSTSRSRARCHSIRRRVNKTPTISVVRSENFCKKWISVMSRVGSVNARAQRVSAKAMREQQPTIPEGGVSAPHKSEGDPATATFAARDEIKKLSEAPGPNEHDGDRNAQARVLDAGHSDEDSGRARRADRDRWPRNRSKRR